MSQSVTPRLVWSVAALIDAVSDALAARFSAVTVRGELSVFNRAPSGHCYFSLKDADGGAALLRCAMFRRTGQLLDFAPRDGQLVELRGRLAMYEPRGELQFVVEFMRPAGAGALYEQFLRLKARLEAEGLFDDARKRALPVHPRTVGIVTSLAAAALHDVLSVIARRAPHVRVIVYPSPVQGPEAPAALASAIERANAHGEADVLVVCRGGGSLEDLWAFNDERVVRAVAASALPVVSAVGHETDVTLADLAADRRAPTPSVGAELVAPPQDDLMAQLATLERRLQRALRHRLDTLQQRLDRSQTRLARPTQWLGRERLRLALLGERLPRAARQGSERCHARLRAVAHALHGAATALPARRALDLRHLALRLEALDPHRVLARGYALVQSAAGELLTSPAQVEAGDTLRLTLATGGVEVRVDTVRAHSDQPL